MLSFSLSCAFIASAVRSGRFRAIFPPVVRRQDIAFQYVLRTGPVQIPISREGTAVVRICVSAHLIESIFNGVSRILRELA